ncbi:MAG: hypothetical protein AAFV88_22200 [Planctomycetota bacterium]
MNTLPSDTPNAPSQSLSLCPICEAGLCGIRICLGDDPTEANPNRGFVMCDECEAVWLEPDTTSQHVYVDPDTPRCPVCQGGLWQTSRWASKDEVSELGWCSHVDSSLTP